MNKEKNKQNKIEYNELIGMTLEEFYNNNTGLIKYFAFNNNTVTRAEDKGIDYNDLYSAGTQGLIHVYKKYSRPEIKLSAYLGKCIKLFIWNLFNEEGNAMIKIPDNVRTLHNRIKRDKENLKEDGRIKLSIKEIMEKYEINRFNAESVLICDDLDMQLKKAYHFNEPLERVKINKKTRQFANNKAIENLELSDMISNMNEKDQLISMKKMDGYSDAEIGEILGITRQAVHLRVSRYIKPMLKTYCEDNGLDIGERMGRRSNQRRSHVTV